MNSGWLKSASIYALLIFVTSVPWATPASANEPPSSLLKTDKPPVVFLILDELPTVSLITKRNEIFKSRFPHFDRLTKQAFWYPDHTTNAHMTYRSVPSMLSGKLPALEDQYPTERNHPVNLFTIMDENGYSLNGGETTTQICSQVICPLPSSSIFAESDYINPSKYSREKAVLNRTDARRGNMRWAKNLKLQDGQYSFRHSMIPHEAYVFLPNGKMLAGHPIPRLGGAEGGNVSKQSGAVSVAYHQSLLQIGYIDRVIGFIRNRAIKQGKWKDMMLIVTSDHGSNFRRGGHRRRVSDESVGSIAFTPLFIKYPGSLSGGISEKPTQSIDILPTMAEYLNLDIDPVDGVSIPSLFSLSRDIDMDNNLYSLPGSKAKRRVDVAYRDRMLRTGPLYRIGPSARLINRRAPRRRLKRRHGRKARLDQPSQYRRVATKRNVVPAMITGVTRMRAGTTVAIGLNGVIRATARVFADGRKMRFGGVVNPAFFRKRNRLQIFKVVRGRVRGRIG